MKGSNDITRVYEQYFRDSFGKLGLAKYEEMYGPGVGALIKFKNDSFKIQILNDRGILEIGISSVFGDEQFRGLEMFNSLLQLETNKNVNESEKEKYLGLDWTTLDKEIFYSTTQNS